MELSETLGDYRLLEPLGRGGMGVVYLGKHLESGELAAIKTIPVADRRGLQSLRREIRALASLRHPGIVRIVGHGIEGGLPWYAMEYLPGKTLRQRIEELQQSVFLGPSSSVTVADEARAALGKAHYLGETEAVSADELDGLGACREGGEQPFPRGDGLLHAALAGGQDRPEHPAGEAASASLAAKLTSGGPVAELTSRGPAAKLTPELEESLSLVRSLCVPLAFLHGEGLVHRDLKPENILIRPDGQPVIVDFGLLHRFAGERGRETLQLGSLVAGTVAYMPPEQIQGRLVDARADLYGLGCILYELLTGQPPFIAGSVAGLLRAHLEESPMAPSELRPGLSWELDDLVLRLLSKRPQDRLGHAADVAVVLTRLGARNDYSEVDRPVRPYLYRPELRGRGELLGGLKRLLDALDRGSGAMAFLGGESGVGKTRLALEAARMGRELQIGVLSGQCGVWSGEESPNAPRGSALHPLRETLQTVADLCRETGLEETKRILGQRGKLLARYEPSLLGLPGQELQPDPAVLPFDAARVRLFEWLAETLARFCVASPHLLVIDDLQWADELTLGFLKHLLVSGELDGMALLVVGIYRSDEAAGALGSLLELPGTQKMVLDRLGEDDVGAMVMDMLALRAPPKRFVRFLSRQSEGNPFFVAEYLRSAVAQGVLYRDELGQWQVSDTPAGGADPYEELPLPASLFELVGGRLARLDGMARRLLDAVALLGGETGASLAAKILAFSDDQMALAIHELRGAQLIEELADEKLKLLHGKIREVAYTLLASETRRRLHRLAARELELLLESDAQRDRAPIARHWEAAGEPEKAGLHYVKAARDSSKRYAHEEAERLLRASLRLGGAATSESVAARRFLAREVLYTQGRLEEAVEELQQALEDSLALGLREEEETILRGLGDVLHDLGRSREAWSYWRRALDLARQSGDQARQGAALSKMAVLAQERGEIADARELYTQALEIHRATNQRHFAAVTLGNFATLEQEQGNLDHALELHEEALRLKRNVGSRIGESVTLTNMANLHRDLGDLERARALCEEAFQIAREVGDQDTIAWILWRLGLVRSEQGKVTEAKGLLTRALTLLRKVGNRRFEAGLLRDLHRLVRRLGGNFKELQPLVERAEAILREVGDPLHVSACLCERGHAELGAGRSAAHFLAEAEETTASLGLDSHGQTDVSRALRALGRAQKAFDSGDTEKLFRGELVEDLPEGLKRVLQKTGQLSSEAPESVHSISDRSRPG